MIQMRRYMHQYPEPSFEETWTHNYILNQLSHLDCEIVSPVGRNGIKATFKGKENGPTIAFRADFDALPVQELNDVPYKSKNDGFMHACGHDGHTTALMLFVKRCKAMADQHQLPHNVVFIFQPAEETGGGANRLIKAGAFNQYPIEAVFGIHVNPFADEGQVVIRDEEITASATEYRFFLKGLSSHVADKEQGHSCG
ncbi:MAG: hydrolase, partial [Staphylococcus epidermidis]